MGILEDGPYAHGKGLTAVVALHDAIAGAFTGKGVIPLYTATVPAYRNNASGIAPPECELCGWVVHKWYTKRTNSYARDAPCDAFALTFEPPCDQPDWSYSKFGCLSFFVVPKE